MNKTWSIATLGVALIANGINGSQALAQGRPAEPALSLEHARERAARISDVRYAVELSLDTRSTDFSGRVAMRFDLSAAAPQRDLTIDFRDGGIASVIVNGRATDAAYNEHFITVPGTALGSGPNLIEVTFTHPYSNDGSGLYRFEDPEDGRVYLYTDFEPYEQNRLFPSFDQPDLKARYTTIVRVPADWMVIANVAETEIVEDGETRVWSFPETLPISTYIYALHAGQYHVWESMAEDIPLRLFARESLVPYVHPEDWFGPTRQGFEFYQAYFDMPYPFGKYDQIIVPHFNAGAMENVAAVTFSEGYLTRGAVTRQDRRSIASVILHEMAHMWFGDIVTMDWWNGLWLNESFATFMATLSMAEATEFTDEWQSAFRRTISAYEADERETTHPIELPIPDTDAAFANFDAITYNKGSAVLAQLNYLVGPDVFRRGVSDYLQAHAYGNTTIDDFLDAISNASGIDLGDWARDWLGEPGTNDLEARYECRDGSIAAMSLVQRAPENWPTLRQHRTQLGLYRFVDGRVQLETVSVLYDGARTEVESAIGLACPDVVYANHGDWDYVHVRLDAGAIRALKMHLNDFDEPLTRAMLWQSVYDTVLDAELTPVAFIDFALANVGSETVDEVVAQVLGEIGGAYAYIVRIAGADTALNTAERLEDFLWQAAAASPAGSDRQLLFFDRYLSTARSTQARDRLATWLTGDQEDLPAGVTLDQDRRWASLLQLAGLGDGRVESLLEAERERDPSDDGRLQAISVAAAAPDPERQRELADRLLQPPPALSAAEARAIAGGLFPLGQESLRRPVAEAALARLPDVDANVDPIYYGAITGGLLRPVCDESFLGELNAAIDGAEGLHPSLHKSLLDLRFDVRRCLAIESAMDGAR